MQYPQYKPTSDNLPLSDDELNDLDTLLGNLPTDAAMNIEALDGYLSGLLLTPGRQLADLPGEAWLPLIWGGDGDTDPAPFPSGKQRKKAVLLALRHLHSIATAWALTPKAWEPIFSFAEGEDEDTEYADAEDWAAGFLMAVELAPDAWAPLFDGADTADLLAPIAALGGEDGALAEAAAAERDVASRAIPDAMLALWAR
ncbi:YecA family protein, partial [Pelomonas sp. HMWF004]